ncbi:hypothetical protein FDENT_11395 [Fusarium denticulatum]|uniref:Uncharacterized protein n=1 Tax=Fusarium denticulatum TaxID=48507 RepID=A0A8H5TI06_9HYPO|nr:hypothetical protein FDENT_11395 [Fusarium denticulatum]
MLSRQETIVTRLNLPERFNAASGEFRTVWPEGVIEIAENMHVPTPEPAAETKPAVEAKFGGTVAVVDHESQLKGTPLLFWGLPYPVQYVPHGASRYSHVRTEHTPKQSPTLTFCVPNDISDSEEDEPELLGASGYHEKW